MLIVDHGGLLRASDGTLLTGGGGTLVGTASRNAQESRPGTGAAVLGRESYTLSPIALADSYCGSEREVIMIYNRGQVNWR